MLSLPSRTLRFAARRCLAVRFASSSSSSGSPVPVVDLAPFLTGNDQDKMAVASEIASACEHIGFFAIRNHGVDEDLISVARQAGRDFFDLDEASKMDGTGMTEDYPYGYVPLGGERLSAGKAAEDGGSKSDSDAQKVSLPDINESFTLGPGNPASGMPPRQWPKAPAHFPDAIGAYYAEMEGLAATLLRAFALGLDLPETWFENKIDRHRCALRMLNYPDLDPTVPRQPGQLRAGAHTDYGSLTILLQDAAPGGLQVMADDARSGGWREVPAVPGTFVVNLGDLMRRWTNDRWMSTLHRVVLPPEDAQGSCRRQSMAFFHNINPDHVVECIPTCVSAENPPKHPPIKAFDFLMEKHLAATGGGKK